MAFVEMDFASGGGNEINPSANDYVYGSTNNADLITVTFPSDILTLDIVSGYNTFNSDIARKYSWNVTRPNTYLKNVNDNFSVANVGDISAGGIAEISGNTAKFTPYNDNNPRWYGIYVTLK